MAEYQRSFDALDGQEEASSSEIAHEVRLVRLIEARFFRLRIY